MRAARRALIAGLLVGNVLPVFPATSRAVPADSASARPFVIAAEGRFDHPGDRRLPRQLDVADSALAAYADVEVVVDGTWLRHELAAYARRVACSPAIATCRLQHRTVAGAAVLHITAGAHAELVWLSDGNRAVRLGWRRVVDAGTGTMIAEAPPEPFVRRLLAELPSRLEAEDAREPAPLVEVDRLLYYAERAAAALAQAKAGERHRLQRFIAGNLARVRRLQVAIGDSSSPIAVEGDPTAAPGPTSPAEELESLRRWHAARQAQPWCSAENADRP